MRRILIIGCGDVGLRTARLLLSRHRIFALAHGDESVARLRTAGLTPVRGDLDDARSLARLAGLADCIFHFAPPAPAGAHDTRTRNLLAALGKRAILPQRMVYISTSGVYGDCGGALIDETRPPQPQTGRACRRLDAEQQVRAWGQRQGVAVSILRVPGIYAENRLPIERLARGTPALRREDDVYTNHIHADDLARIAVHALYRGRPGRVYHASDDSRLTMGDYFDRVAAATGLPPPMRVSRAEAEARLAPSLLSFLRESRRLVNQRIKTELGVRLAYPDVDTCLLKVGATTALQ